MSEILKLVINDDFPEYGRDVLEFFTSYQVESDLFIPDDAFSVELADYSTKVEAGDSFKLILEGEVLFVGLVDHVERSYSKDRHSLKISGRDILSLLVDSYITTFPTYKKEHGNTLYSVATELTKDMFKMADKDIEFEPEIATKVFEPLDSFTPNPGETVFERLSKLAVSKGILFTASPEGALRFTNVPSSLLPSKVLKNCKAPKEQENNILSGIMSINKAKSYSNIFVGGQSDISGLTSEESTQWEEVPQVIDGRTLVYKPYFTILNKDRGSQLEHADSIRKKQKKDALRIEYVVAGHAQNGSVWRPRDLVSVIDEDLQLNQTFVVYSCSYHKSKAGTTTKLILGLPENSELEES